MQICPRCGADLIETSKFCGKCGNQTSVAMAAVVPPAPIVVAPAKQLWYVTYATGHTGGPFTEDDIRAMIARQEIKITDAVAVQGSTMWLPITQSPFAAHVAHQTTMDRLASSTCPRCGGAMVAVSRRSGTSKAFLIVGMLTIWLLGFGIIFLIIGYIAGRNPILRYECPRCKYKAK